MYVDNRFTPESALHVPNDYYTYGGITRPVAVEQLKDVYIKNVQFEPIYQEMGGKLESELYFQIYRRKNIVCRLERFLLRIVCMRKMELV